MSTGVIYSGGSRALNTFDGSTAQSILDGIKNSLLATGWSLFSSFPGSGATTGYKLNSALSVHLLQCRVKLEYNGNGIPFGPAVVEVTFSDNTETNIGYIHYLGIVASRSYYIISCPYQLFIFKDNSSVSFDAYTVMGGIPANPKNTSAAFWSMGNYDFTGISFVNTFIQNLTPNASTSSYLYNTHFTKGQGLYAPQLLTQQGATAGSAGSGKTNQFASGCYPVVLPSIVYGETSSTKPRIRGYLWDAVVVGTGFSWGLQKTFDGHGYINLTDSNNYGSLWVCYTPDRDGSPVGYAY